MKCTECNEELDTIYCVCEEVNIYELTENDDMEFVETRDSDIVQYKCPHCLCILDNETVNNFKIK